MGKSILAASAIALIVILNPGRASALAISWPAGEAILNQILAELQTQTGQNEEMITALEEIQAITDRTEQAIGPASVVPSASDSILSLDAQQIGSTIPQLDFLDLGKDMQLPDLTNLTAAKNELGRIYGIFDRAHRAAKSKDKKKILMSAKEIQRVVKARQDTLNKAAADGVSVSMFSLSQGPHAKSNERGLDVSRRSASNLRTDLNALHKTQLELLARINHMIVLQGHQGVLMGAEKIMTLPLGDTDRNLPSGLGNGNKPSGNPGGINLEKKE